MPEYPNAFLQEMAPLLGADFGAFRAALEAPPQRGLRLNPKKPCGPLPFGLEPVPWCPDGYYYTPEERPGLHPLHEAGAYYIQEPSAMSVAEVAAGFAGRRVLDLCAAPGGKATHMAGRMAGAGTLVANEYVPNRANTLSRNVERMGVGNCIVTNETPQRLADAWGPWFDTVLVDAPCSGEGMFRRDEAARLEWAEDAPARCAARQLDILEDAQRLLAPGGTLLYSTCTFSQTENEDVVLHFLAAHPDFFLSSSPLEKFFSPALSAQAKGCMRIWPHCARGEGHFIAVLQRTGRLSLPACKPPKPAKTPPELADFWRENIALPLPENLATFGAQLYALPEETPPLHGLRVLRPGLHLGECRKGRFVPGHGLAMWLSPGHVRHAQELGDAAGAYLQGETFPCPAGEKGFALACTGGVSVGWLKADGRIYKNHYPRGLRR